MNDIRKWIIWAALFLIVASIIFFVSEFQEDINILSTLLVIISMILLIISMIISIRVGGD